MINLTKIKKVHFIGIGGIGISAIARMMLSTGKTVSGSDQSSSAITAELAAAGVTIYEGHRAEQVPLDADLVVYTIAVPPTNPELNKARELKLPTASYPEVIGEISRQKKTVAVAGTHGKTTTTAMLASIVLSADLDPTVVVGSILKSRQSNFIAGQGELFIVEACEYRRSFLNLSPDILIITNIEADHLDYYRDLADIQSAFADLVSRVPADGAIICSPADPATAPVLTGAVAAVVDYTQFDLNDVLLTAPGEHNRRNAQAAAATADWLGLGRPVITNALADFAGTWRRFDYQGRMAGGAEVYDDYAHHPTEVKMALQAAKTKAGTGRVVAVFQPHLYSRTKHFLAEFAEALALAEVIVVAPIYAAREVADDSVSADQLVSILTRSGASAHLATDLIQAENIIREVVKPTDLVITLGAGDIFTVAARLIKVPPTA